MVIKMYFRLNPECYFIRGETCGAIFDLIDATIYALNQQETEIVTSCEKNNPVSSDEKFLGELKQLRLGNFYPNKVYIQKLKMDTEITKSDSLSSTDPPEIQRAFLEINNSCNRDCWFCGYHGIKRSAGCLGCNKWKDNDRHLAVERLKGIVDELKDLDCRDIFITGGDLTLAWDRTIDILDYAKGKFNNVYVTLHQKSLSSDIISSLENKAKIIAQTEDINSVKSKEITTLLVMKPTDWGNANNIDGKDVIKDFIIDDETYLQKELSLISRDGIHPVKIERFLDNILYHPCLGHAVSICYNGNVVPCPMMRNHIFGNVDNVDLSTIIGKMWKEINNYWSLNLDKIEKCTDCEFRYACNDCRAIEESLTGRLKGKILCGYDPREGVWR